MGRRRAKNLLLDKQTLNNAEEYCRQLGTPMSRLIEDFLEALPELYKSEIKSPIVQRLYGATSSGPMKTDDYRDFLYGRRERKRAPRTSRG
jgi:hypothetical protein